MGRYRYPGDVPYVERAARELGREPDPTDTAAARKVPHFAEITQTLINLSGLEMGGQAEIDAPGSTRKAADEFLARAQAARDRIDLTLKAADLAIADARAAFPAEQPATEPEPTPTAPQPTEPAPAPEPEPEPAPVPEPSQAELPTAEPADETDVESHSRRRRRNW